jgi:hypothetical protein
LKGFGEHETHSDLHPDRGRGLSRDRAHPRHVAAVDRTGDLHDRSLAKAHEFKLGFKEIGYSAMAIWGISTLLKDAALEILNFFPVIGWAAEVIVAVLFVFFLGNLAGLYFRKKV